MFELWFCTRSVGSSFRFYGKRMSRAVLSQLKKSVPFDDDDDDMGKGRAWWYGVI